MIELYFVLGAVALAASIAGVFAKKRKKPPCLSCKHLGRYGGGKYGKYYCLSDNMDCHYFDKPPKYCRYYEPEGENSK